MNDVGTKDEAPKDDGRLKYQHTERLESLRERLYARGEDAAPVLRERHALTPSPIRTQSDPVGALGTPVTIVETPHAPITAHTPVPPVRKPRRRARFVLLTFLVFLCIAIGAGIFFLTGKNGTSGDNISIDVQGPMTVGGGDVMDLVVSVGNTNTQPIDSATLIVTYPRGTQSVTEPGRLLFTERQSLNTIKPGESVNIPLRALIFGESEEAKEVAISVEYRVKGSNATFVKDALPYTFRLSSSPVVLNVLTVKSVSPGQTVPVTLEIISNAREELRDVVVKTDYPRNFTFTAADPAPVSGQDTWKISSLKPGEKKVISVSGTIAGEYGDTEELRFEAGVPDARSPYLIASSLARGSATFGIERPYLDVEVTINGKSDDVVTVSPNSGSTIYVKITNTSKSTVYDARATARIDGNANNEERIRVDQGMYDSITNTATWDSISHPELREIPPGEERTLSLSVMPLDSVATNPEITFALSLEGVRAQEGRVSERLDNIAVRTLRVPTKLTLNTAAIYSDGPFGNSGPMPPQAERQTEFTILMSIKNSINEIRDAKVVARVPQYIEWADRVEGGQVTYDRSSRTLVWNAGTIPANGYKEVWMQVRFTPSLSQVGTSPRLLEEQNLTARDAFTNESVTAYFNYITTSLLQDPNEMYRNGDVRAN